MVVYAPVLQEFSGELLGRDHGRSCGTSDGLS